MKQRKGGTILAAAAMGLLFVAGCVAPDADESAADEPTTTGVPVAAGEEFEIYNVSVPLEPSGMEAPSFDVPPNVTTLMIKTWLEVTGACMSVMSEPDSSGEPRILFEAPSGRTITRNLPRGNTCSPGGLVGENTEFFGSENGTYDVDVRAAGFGGDIHILVTST